MGLNITQDKLQDFPDSRLIPGVAKYWDLPRFGPAPTSSSPGTYYPGLPGYRRVAEFSIARKSAGL